MTIQEIIKRINGKLAGELLTYSELLPFLDNVIDDINIQLSTCYPVFSEIPEGKTDYDYFPDMYIRSVVVPGAAWYYFVMDEEGIPTATQFQSDYQLNLFHMHRDMMYHIPEEYQIDTLHGAMGHNFEQSEIQGGMFVDGSNFRL